MTEPTSSPPASPPGRPADPSASQPDDPTAPLWPPAAPPVPPGAVPPREVAAAGAGGEGDRVWVHFIWEALLVVAVVAVVLALWLTTGRVPLDTPFFGLAGALGLVAMGLAASLRAAVPNLAVGTIAASAGGFCALLAADYDWGFWPALAATVGAGLVVGVVLAVVVVGLSVPAWAASLGMGVALSGLALTIAHGRPIAGEVPGLPTAPPGWLIFAAFVVLSICGGVIWLIPPVRRKLSGTRHAADPARYGGRGAAVGGALALVVSSLLATFGGVVMLLQFRGVTLIDTSTYVALAGVLLGGVSVFGRRAGVAGTVLGVLFMLLAQRLVIVNNLPASWVTMAVGAAILVGLAVSRILEAVGRKRPASPPPAGAQQLPWQGTGQAGQ